MSKAIKLTEEKIGNTILILRGKRVIIDSDLAEFYGATTKALNRAVKRNIDRFPEDFMLKLTPKEKEYVIENCSHLSKLKFSPHLPFAFTEHGAVMAANVLNSQVAVQASLQVVRVFIRVSELLSNNKVLADKIEKLELKLKGRLNKHDKEIKTLFEAIHLLIQPPNPPRKKIGYKLTEEQ